MHTIVTKRGNEQKLRWSHTALKDEDGAATAVLAIGIDVTELLEAQKAAAQAARLAAIGQTMAVLTHESRNILQRIQASLEMLQLELEDHPTAKAYLCRIERAADNLGKLHEQVRTFAAPIELELRERFLPVVWRQAWEHLAEARTGREVTLVEEIGESDLKMTLDASRLEQVFRNLFENTLAACRDPVRITVACSATTLHGQAAVEIRMRDNGPGLTAEQSERVFEAFYTTKTSGTGLGLTIVTRIVEAHRGTIRLESKFTEGAEFVIMIPRCVHC